MRRIARQADANGISLFPFLAVLLCTMGALLVILVVIAEQARANAAREAQQLDAPTAEELQANEDLKWQIEQFAQARQTTAQQLERSRHELSHLEDHILRLRGQVEELRAAAAALEANGQQSQQQRAMAEAEIEIIEAEIERTKDELAQVRRENLDRPKSYAIIPYEGPNQTQRRPIYIECRADSVVLQPEGTVLRREDFEGPLGPGNPLASALRVTSEHLRRADPRAGDPYPLLLVRPDGIMAYYRVREAIESWGPDFGYELIDGEWNLELPTADPYLAGAQQQAVEAGRQLQQRLVAAAPSQYAKRPQYRASPSGRGFVREDDFQRLGGGTSYGNGASSVAGSFGETSSNGAGEQAFGGPRSALSGAAQGQSSHASQQAAQTTGPGRTSVPGHASGNTDGVAGGTQAAGSTQGGGGVGSPGENAANSAPTSLASRRGRDWALQDRSPKSTPVTRPIRIAVRSDWLAVINKQGTLLTKPIALPGGVEASVDEFVATIWAHTESWGIAGSGLYWRPVLVLDVDPAAIQQARELQILLENSGMDIQPDGVASP
ncbi:MAG: hypothetical protein KDA42_08455 [Planctomycetales bacterium]|nr:hypothetical protein [Planctomycetales bacterium]